MENFQTFSCEAAIKELGRFLCRNLHYSSSIQATSAEDKGLSTRSSNRHRWVFQSSHRGSLSTPWNLGSLSSGLLWSPRNVDSGGGEHDGAKLVTSWWLGSRHKVMVSDKQHRGFSEAHVWSCHTSIPYQLQVSRSLPCTPSLYRLADLSVQPPSHYHSPYMQLTV